MSAPSRLLTRPLPVILAIPELSHAGNVAEYEARFDEMNGLVSARIEVMAVRQRRRIVQAEAAKKRRESRANSCSTRT